MKFPLFLRFGEDARYEKAVRRLRKLPTTQVVDWGMNSLWGVQAGLERFHMHNEDYGLDEARQGAVNMLAVTDVLLERRRT